MSHWGPYTDSAPAASEINPSLQKQHDRARIEEVARVERTDPVRLGGEEEEIRFSDFAMLCLRRLDAAYRLAWALTGDAGTAQSVTHQAMADAWRHRRVLDDGRAFGLWLDRALVARALERLPRQPRQHRAPVHPARPAEVDAAWAPLVDAQSRRPVDELAAGWSSLVPASSEPATASAAAVVLGRHADDRVAVKAVYGLEPLGRVVVLLRYWADLSLDEIASRLGKDETAIATRVGAATDELAATLGYPPAEAAPRLREALHRELVPPLAAPYELRHGIETREMLQPVRARGRRRQGVVAAALSLVAALVLVSVGLLTPHRASPGADPELPLTVDAFGRIDRNAGWATLDQSLFITRDGGRIWRKGSLPVPVANFGPRLGDANTGRLYFADPDNGWLVKNGEGAYGGSGLPAVIYRTRDGGKTWAPTQIAGNGVVVSFDFVDANHAWLAMVPVTNGLDITMPTTGGDVRPNEPPTTKILATVDGGLKWEQVVAIDGFSEVDFETADEGWALSQASSFGGTDPITGMSYRLHHLLRGGRMASSSALPIPSGCIIQTDPGAPVSAGGRRMKLTLICADYTLEYQNGQSQQLTQAPLEIVTLASNDLGETWELADRVAVGGTPTPISFDAARSLHQPLLFMDGAWLDARASFDGGASWRTYSSVSLGGAFSQIEFASPEDVWAARSGVGNGASLYASSDGGKTWRPLLAPPDKPVPLAIGSQTPTPITAPTPFVTALPMPATVVLGFQLVSDRVGWAIVASSGSGISGEPRLYVTQDGGASWHAGKIPPSSLIPDGIDFLDEFRGWSVSPLMAGGSQTDSSVYVAQTENGGVLWTGQEVKLSGVHGDVQARIHPRTALDAEMIVSPWGDATQDCYRLDTSDGGRTWSKPRSFACLDPRYSDRSNGFSMPRLRDGANAVIWTTADGGATWVEGKLPAETPATADVVPLLVYDDPDGNRRLVYAEDAGQLVTAVSKDAGKTWTRVASFATQVISPSAGRIYGNEIRVLGGVATGLGIQPVMLASSNAGIDWQTLPLDGLSGTNPVAAFQGSTGWVALTQGCGNDGCQRSIFRSPDTYHWYPVSLP